MGLGLTVIVVGLVLLGVWGTWRLATVFPSNRARIAALVVYAAMPLVPGVISTGRLSALVAYAIVPWFVHLLRAAAGIGTADPSAEAQDLVEGVLDLRAPGAHPPHRGPRPRRRPSPWRSPRRCCRCSSSSPSSSASRRSPSAPVCGPPAWLTGLGLVACAAAFVLNLPWSTTWSWDDLVAPPLAGAPGRGLVEVASMAIGHGRFEVLALALYVPVLVALLVARAWRLTWAARAAGLVVVFLPLAILQDRDALPFGVPEVGILLAPVASGLALAAASSVAAFGRGRRRAHVRLAPAARPARRRRRRASGVVPGPLRRHRRRVVRARVDARRGRPGAVAGRHRARADGSRPVGDYRVLYLGDPRLIPFPSTDIGDGVAMALVDDGAADLRDRWAVTRPAGRRPAAGRHRPDRHDRHAAAAAGCSPRSASARSSCRPRRRTSTASDAAADPRRPDRRPRWPARPGRSVARRRRCSASTTRRTSRRPPCSPARWRRLGGRGRRGRRRRRDGRRDAGVRRRRHDAGRPAATSRPASSTSAPRGPRLASSRSAARRSPARTAFGATTAFDVADRRAGRARSPSRRRARRG